jgi:hypothetical protein
MLVSSAKSFAFDPSIFSANFKHIRSKKQLQNKFFDECLQLTESGKRGKKVL